MLETIQHFGYLGVFLTIFLEIGLMIFPLPGDTLLFTTGIISMSGALDFKTLVIVSILASFLSGHLGYLIGTKIDRETLKNNRIYKVKESHLHKTEKFFEQYGVWAILFSRFVPVVRNFISQLLGIIKYEKKHFFWANLGASILWPTTVISLGYLLGKMFPNLVVYAEYAMLIVLVVLAFPVAYEFWKTRKE